MEESISMALRNLQKSITCSICLDYFSDPITVLCGHSFCKTCIDQALIQKSFCPICSSKIRKRTIESNGGLQPLISKIAIFVDDCHSSSDLPLNVHRGAHGLSTKIPIKNVKPPIVPVEVISVDESTDCGQQLESGSRSYSNPSMLPVVRHKIGSLVNVSPRLWIGINRPGGTARIVDVVTSDMAITCYTVKYVLDGRVEMEVAEEFVEVYSELDRSSRKSKAPPQLLESADHFPKKQPQKRAKSSEKKGIESVPKDTNSGDMYWSAEASSCSTVSGGMKSTASRHTVRSSRTAPIVMLSTSLDPELQSKLQQLAELCPGVIVSNSFSDAVTHLVVSTDRDRKMKQRTMKYMQALISGKWIVSVEWVIDSLEKHSIQTEEAYEVRKNVKATEHFAPRRARLAVAANTAASTTSAIRRPTSSSQPDGGALSDLFANCVVLLHGQFPTPGPPRSEIQFLLVRGGATVSASVEDFVQCVAAKEHSSKHKIVLCSAKAYEEEFMATPNVRISETIWSSMNQFCKQYNVTILSHAWVLDCVVNYKILPLSYPLV